MESRVRERLHDLANDAPTGFTVPAALTRRARRRVARNIGAGVVVLTVVAFGVWVGVRAASLGSYHPVTKPRASLFDRVRGWIAFQGDSPSTGGAIVAVDPADPAKQVLLTPRGGSSGVPIGWSRNGARLLLRRDSLQQGSDLYVLNANGTETRVTYDHEAFSGSLSPNGATVVYWSERTGDLSVVNSDGGSPRLLARHPRNTFLVDPAWSPDGSRIAFLTVSNPFRGPWTVSIMNADGSGRHVLVDLRHIPGDDDGGLAWAPDGSRLAFYAGFKDHWKIYVAAADGAGLRSITREGSYFDLAWSPDGSRIAFVRRGRLFTMAADGGDVRVVNHVTELGITWIAWNPVP